MRCRFALAFLWIACWGTAQAEPLPVGLTPLGPAQISAIGEDGGLILEDGRHLRLAGIELPRRALGETGPHPLPLTRQAHEALAGLIQGAPPSLYQAAPQPDRWGRLPVHLVSQDGQWVQAALLRQGLARVATSLGDRLAASEMLSAEAEARDAKLGLWADPDFAVRRSEGTLEWLDSVQVVEGVVSSADSVRGVVYLNFGDDWKHSLGIRIPHGLLSHLAYDPTTLKGHRLRVRGWIGKGVGPMIEVSHAEQIEVLDGPPLTPVAAKESR